ncbi:MAG: phosphoribosylanthranilate isomerase, partial [Gammaproteobacteria bacterium]|nr:phosphoribosylanthranilate isomerase [Gammaproteobacteria bacterium]
MRTRVKICGITRPEDGQKAAASGADAIGLVFYAKSPRAVSIEQAQAIVEQLPVFVSIVALFVDASADEVKQVLAQVDIDIIQFHGNESTQECEQYQHRYIKAIRMSDDVDLQAVCEQYSTASAILVDSYHKGVPGGTGESFDWERIPEKLAGNIILAGGLDSNNVSSAIQTVRPWAVDVSSGVESEKGLKDESKI